MMKGRMHKGNKILVISAFSFVGTMIFTFLAFPGIVNFVVRDQTSLKRRNMMRKFYLKIPMPLTFSVFFFNISNPEEVQRGGKPILTQVGPYCYDAYKEKIEISENEGEDSLSYTPYETYFFNQQLSAPLTENDYVTVLNPIVVGVVHIVSRDLPPFIPIADRAMKYILDNPKSIYLKTKVKDFLFEGLVLNCTSPDFSVKAVCAQVKSLLVGLKEVQKNVYTFSMLGPRNGTLPNRFKILRGIKKSHELGRLVELNHEKEQAVWNAKKCNRFEGTDSWIFPPFVDKTKGVRVFSSDICRNLRLQYIEDMVVHGIDVQKYYADIGDMSRLEEKCYCRTSKTCLPKGVLDLQGCMGVPVFATLPHFLLTDENLLMKIDGMHPVTDQHIVRILMQPLLAVPLEAQKRLQFNMFIKPVSKIEFMKRIPDLLHPIFWVEESIVLEGTLLNLIKSVFILLKVFDVLNYVLIGCSVVGIGAGSVIYYKNRQSVAITPLGLDKKSESSSAKEVILKSAGRTPEKNFERIDTASEEMDEESVTEKY